MKQKNYCMDKKKKKSLKKEYESRNKISKEEWELEMLENNNYDDIDFIEKHNKPIKKKLKYWEEEYEPSSNFGKWWASIQISKLKNKLKHYVK